MIFRKRYFVASASAESEPAPPQPEGEQGLFFFSYVPFGADPAEPQGAAQSDRAAPQPGSPAGPQGAVHPFFVSDAGPLPLVKALREGTRRTELRYRSIGTSTRSRPCAGAASSVLRLWY